MARSGRANVPLQAHEAVVRAQRPADAPDVGVLGRGPVVLTVRAVPPVERHCAGRLRPGRVVDVALEPAEPVVRVQRAADAADIGVGRRGPIVGP